MKHLKTALVYLLMISAFNLGATEPAKEKITMGFDDASLQKIYLHPEVIIEDFEGFWSSDEAYKLVKRIHKNNNLQVPMEDWKRKITGISRMPLSERKANKGFVVAQEIMGYEKKFRTEGIPHLRSFLPADTRSFSKMIYLTSEINFRCFMTNGNVVVNVNATYFDGDSEGIMNSLVHEVFHIGYGFNRYNRSEAPLDDEQQYFFLDALQNEGLATYVGYTAQKIFKGDHEKDYTMLEDEREFFTALKKVNGLFAKAKSGKKQNLRKESWKLGVTGRAYYVLGAVMAKTIDHKLGRAALIETISKGPRSFVTIYNSLAPDERKVVEFPAPAKLTLFQKLKSALMENRLDEFNALKADLLKSTKPVDPKLSSKLNSLGYAMIYKKRVKDAIEVFTLNTALFPTDANAFDSLAEAYMLDNDKDSAIKYYKKSLTLNPKNNNAEDMLKKLGATL